MTKLTRRPFSVITQQEFDEIKDLLKIWSKSRVSRVTRRSATTIKNIAVCNEFDEYRAYVRVLYTKYKQPLVEQDPTDPTPIPDEQPKPEQVEPVVTHTNGEWLEAMTQLTSELRSVANELRLARVAQPQRRGMFTRG